MMVVRRANIRFGGVPIERVKKSDDQAVFNRRRRYYGDEIGTLGEYPRGK